MKKMMVMTKQSELVAEWADDNNVDIEIVPLTASKDESQAMVSRNEIDGYAIALTDYSFDEDVQRSLQIGMNAHLKKPVEAETLIRVLGELIYESEQKM